MRFLIRLLVFLFVTWLAGYAALAQTATGTASHDEEDLRKTVRELALRVSALEEELHRQRAGTPIESASLKPAALVLPTVDVRGSVESVSSSGVAGAAPSNI
jgi:hypothetical protein